MAISPKTSTISLKKKLTPKHLEKTFNTVDAYFVIIILGSKYKKTTVDSGWWHETLLYTYKSTVV